MSSIANTKSYQITNPETGERASVIAVLPKSADLDAYLDGAAKRFDWKAWSDQRASVNKVRVGQQKQVKRK
jgi:hypothetical protein